MTDLFNVMIEMKERLDSCELTLAKQNLLIQQCTSQQKRANQADPQLSPTNIEQNPSQSLSDFQSQRMLYSMIMPQMMNSGMGMNVALPMGFQLPGNMSGHGIQNGATNNAMSMSWLPAAASINNTARLGMGMQPGMPQQVLVQDAPLKRFKA
jgi:hypothetical protein